MASKIEDKLFKSGFRLHVTPDLEQDIVVRWGRKRAVSPERNVFIWENKTNPIREIHVWTETQIYLGYALYGYEMGDKSLLWTPVTKSGEHLDVENGLNRAWLALLNAHERKSPEQHRRVTDVMREAGIL